MPSRSWTRRIATIVTVPSDVGPPERKAQSVAGVNTGMPSGAVAFSSLLLATANVHLYSDTSPLDELASNWQSTAPAAVMIEHALAPLEGEVTVNEAPTDGGSTVRMVDIVTPAYVAVMVTGVETLTVDVSIVNVLVVSPAATEIFAGTFAMSGLLLSRTIAALPLGAGAVSLTVAIGRT